MLGKLMKYEFRSGYILLPILFGISLIFGVSSYLFQLGNLIGVSTILSFFSLFIAIGSTFVGMIFAGIRFYKGNFSAEGYLTHTLPISDSKIIFSKLIPAYVALLACYVVFGIAIYLNLCLTNNIIGSIPFCEYSSQIAALCIFFVAACLIQTFSLLAMIYFGISLAHTRAFLKNSLAYSIVFVLVLYFIRSIISIVLMISLPISLSISASGAGIHFSNMLSPFINMLATGNTQTPLYTSFNIGLGSLIGDVVLGVVFLLLTNYLLKNKTSVK